MLWARGLKFVVYAVIYVAVLLVFGYYQFLDGIKYCQERHQRPQASRALPFAQLSAEERDNAYTQILEMAQEKGNSLLADSLQGMNIQIALSPYILKKNDEGTAMCFYKDTQIQDDKVYFSMSYIPQQIPELFGAGEAPVLCFTCIDGIRYDIFFVLDSEGKKVQHVIYRVHEDGYSLPNGEAEILNDLVYVDTGATGIWDHDKQRLDREEHEKQQGRNK